MTFTIVSKTHGSHDVLIDDEDWDKINCYTWSICNDYGYRVRSHRKLSNGKQSTLLLHRFIMGEPKGMVVDHINHNTLDNRKCNLRICTNQQNVHNSLKPKLEKPSTSIYKGVHVTHKYIKAAIRNNNKYIHIGHYTSEIEAARAYDKKAIELFGEFACINGV